MLTTPTVARFQSSAPSSSATETLKPVRSRSFMLRTAWRRSLIDRASSMWSSRVRKAMGIQLVPVLGSQQNRSASTENRELRTCLRDHFRSNPFRDESLDHVARLDVAVVRDRDAALHAVGHFFGIVFKAAQRSDFAFEHGDTVAQEADIGVALD